MSEKLLKTIQTELLLLVLVCASQVALTFGIFVYHQWQIHSVAKAMSTAAQESSDRLRAVYQQR